MSEDQTSEIEPVPDAELDRLEALHREASRAPWRSWVEGRDHVSGDNFIMVGDPDHRETDMYISRDKYPASVADQDFIAAARNSLPRLIAEVRRHRSRSSD